MLRTGKEHLESLRDGRVVYVGSERIDDVTRHPAFAAAAQTVAGIYDLKADPKAKESISTEKVSSWELEKLTTALSIGDSALPLGVALKISN